MINTYSNDFLRFRRWQNAGSDESVDDFKNCFMGVDSHSKYLFFEEK
jgi:hypothetical protein